MKGKLSKFSSTLLLNLRAFWGRAYVRIIATTREPAWLIFDTILPLLALSAYVFVYKALKAPPEFTGFVVLGGAMTAYWINMLWYMASQFFWEKQVGQMELFMIAPMSRMAILLGMAMGSIVSTSTRALSAFFLGVFIFRVKFTISSPIYLLLIFLLTMMALYGMGMLLASLYLFWGREAWHLSSLFEEPIYLLSGFYFPVKSLGIWIATIASLIPITLGLDGIRQIFYGEKSNPFLPIEVELIILFFLATIFLTFSYFSLRKMEEVARREGTLIIRWQ